MKQRIGIAALALLVSVPAFAQVSKCTDAAGKVTYQNGPCPTGAAEAIADGPRKSQAEVEKAKRQAQERQAAHDTEAKALQDRLSPAQKRALVMLCVAFAKASGKNPASVTSDTPFDMTPPILYDGKVNVLIDATNSHGGVVPSQYLCTFKNDQGKWAMDKFGDVK